MKTLDWHKDYPAFASKMLVNLIKLADTLEFTSEQFVKALESKYTCLWGYKGFIENVGAIAAECEAFDHGGNFRLEIAQYHLMMMLREYISASGFLNLEERPCTFEHVIYNIPYVMKSK